MSIKALFSHKDIFTRGGFPIFNYLKFFLKKVVRTFIKTGRGGGQRPFINFIKKQTFWSRVMSLSSVFARRKVSEELEPVIWKVVSSAKRIEKNFEAFGRSLMKNRKRSGPRQLPCGTPHLHSRRQELKNSPLRLRLTY